MQNGEPPQKVVKRRPSQSKRGRGGGQAGQVRNNPNLNNGGPGQMEGPPGTPGGVPMGPGGATGPPGAAGVPPGPPLPGGKDGKAKGPRARKVDNA